MHLLVSGAPLDSHGLSEYTIATFAKEVVKMAGLDWMLARLKKLDRHELELLRGEIERLLSQPQPQEAAPKSEVGHIEVKMIPDTKTGKLYGPYRYYRWWEGGRLRCKYLGKATTQKAQQENESADAAASHMAVDV